MAYVVVQRVIGFGGAYAAAFAFVNEAACAEWPKPEVVLVGDEDGALFAFNSSPNVNKLLVHTEQVITKEVNLSGGDVRGSQKNNVQSQNSPNEWGYFFGRIGLGCGDDAQKLRRFLAHQCLL